MKGLLEDLWDKYQFERTETLLPHEKERLKRLDEVRKKISLSPDSEKAFEDYLEILSDISVEKNKNTFFDGIKFGVDFITETLITPHKR